jgi:endogenous inhibitor of DNA gyrase (YacG/DUF329 family)
MTNITVKCPNCEKQLTWTEQEQFKPFCSERCKLIDFGEWATEQKSIPGEPALSDETDNDLYFQ